MYCGWWWVVVGVGEYILAGGGFCLMVVNIFWLVVGGGAWWWVLVQFSLTLNQTQTTNLALLILLKHANTLYKNYLHRLKN